MASLLRTFRTHLEKLLPMANPSGLPQLNMVIAYCLAELHRAGREFTQDPHGNIWSPGGQTPGRTMVAHTDSVGHGKKPQPQRVSRLGGVYHGDGSRPIGGDDKVGVAIALTLARHDPDFGVLLTADEEIGGIGADRVNIPSQYLMVECDRRGANDMVTEIGGEIMSLLGEKEACLLLPHRVACAGLFTDVDSLVRRGIADMAVNLSCGYYSPHSKSEVVVLSHAIQAMHDARTLLTYLPDDLPPAKYHGQGSGVGSGWEDWTGPKESGVGVDYRACDWCGDHVEWGEIEVGPGGESLCFDCLPPAGWGPAGSGVGSGWEDDTPQDVNREVLRQLGMI